MPNKRPLLPKSEYWVSKIRKTYHTIKKSDEKAIVKFEITPIFASGKQKKLNINKLKIL